MSGGPLIDTKDSTVFGVISGSVPHRPRTNVKERSFLQSWFNEGTANNVILLRSSSSGITVERERERRERRERRVRERERETERDRERKREE